jgi:drug/metabolite transporter (DMT)-like permease
MMRARMLLAFLAIYVIWGSTYYAIRVAVGSIPPLAMMGVRCLAAGALLYAWSRRSTPAPDARAWRAAFVAGGLLFLGSHGSLAWAEQHVASGDAALIGATTPLWLTLIDWRWGSGRMPGAWGRGGLALGFAGVVLLVAPGWGSTGATLAIANAAIVGAAVAWAAGSVYGRRAPLPRDVRQSTAVQLLAGAVWLAAASAATGEWRRFSPSAVTAESIGGLVYLIVFGSVVAFTAYVWLLRQTTAARVGTHAFVNPVVAVLLGAAVGGEAITLWTVASALTIVAGVVLVLLDQSRQGKTAAVSDSPRRRRGATVVAAATHSA